MALGRVVGLVTGGSRGVGAEIARQLAGRGVSVILNYRQKSARAQAVAEEIRREGVQAMVAGADITDPEAVAEMLRAIKERFGRLDVLILNASGGLERGRAEDYPNLVNNQAQLALLDGALPLMVRGARVVFVTSHWAHLYWKIAVDPTYEPVALSKRAGEDALRARLPELEGRGITVAVVSGDIIEGTITPKLLERMSPGLVERRRREVGSLPTVREFAVKIADAALDPNLRTGETLYVGSPGSTGRGGTVRRE